MTEQKKNPVSELDESGLVKYQEAYYGEGYCSARVVWEAATKAQHVIEFQKQGPSLEAVMAVITEEMNYLDNSQNTMNVWKKILDELIVLYAQYPRTDVALAEAVQAERERVLDELAHSLETWDTLAGIQKKISELRSEK